MNCCPKPEAPPVITVEYVINMTPPSKPVEQDMIRHERQANQMMRMGITKVVQVAKKPPKTDDGAPNPRLRHYTPESA